VTREQHIAILGFLDSTLSGDLEPLDVEADAIIRAYLKRHPDAAYYLTMRAMRTAAVPEAAEVVAAPPQKPWFLGIFERREPVIS
jgi:hypothetical protein